MIRLLPVLVTFCTIFILTEGIITDLNSVVGRTITIDTLYREARRASEKTDDAKKDSKPDIKTTAPVIPVKKENELMSDEKIKDTIGDTIMDKAKEDSKLDIKSKTPIIPVKKENELMSDEKTKDTVGDTIMEKAKEDSKLDIKSKTPIIPVKKENELIIDQETKDAICNTIMERAAEFGRDIFHGFGEVFQAIRKIMPPELNLEGWTPLGVKILAYHLRDLDTDNMSSDMLEDIREKVTSKSKDAGRPPLKDKKPTTVDSSYRSITVYTPLGNKFSEDVITCPRVVENNELGVYYVSKEYNINFATDSLTNPIAARFLFHQNDTTGRMDLIAMAEEPAQPLIDLDSEKDIEEIYFERRKGKQPAPRRSQDPICQLDESELFRMCSQIFTSKYFASKVKFPASYSSVLEYDCEENVVQFRKRKEGDKTVYTEWMVVCYMDYQPFGYRPEEKWTFYVSQAYNPDTAGGKTSSSEVFVYNVEDGAIFPMNLFSNVGARMPKRENSRS